jgi:hypothetical protein
MPESTTSHNRDYPMCVPRAVCFWNVQCDSNQLGTGSHNQTTSEMTGMEINYVAKSRSNTI